VLAEETKATIRQVIERLIERRPGFRRRRAQNHLIAEVARTVSREEGRPKVLAVEAGTGTGKSMGYCLGAIPAARARGKKVIVCTGTVVLQEQLLAHDLPALQTLGELPFTAQLAKGRNRYLCQLKLDNLNGHDPAQVALGLGEEAEIDPLWEHPPSAKDLAVIDTLAKARHARTWDGDLDAPPVPIPDTLRPALSATRAQCTNQQCPHFRSCAFFTARRGLNSAEVIVTNHSLLLSDLAMGGGVVLPDLEECVVIIDEAHHLGVSATEHFAVAVPIEALARTLRRLRAPLTAALGALKAGEETVKNAQNDIAFLTTAIDRLSASLATLRPAPPAERHANTSANYRLLDDDATQAVRHHATEAASTTAQLAVGIEKVLAALARKTQDGQIDAARLATLQQPLGPAQERLADAAALFEMLGATDVDAHGVPLARWATWDLRNGRLTTTLHAGPVSSGAALRTLLHDRADAVILTSATLCSLGGFDAFYEAVGLDDEIARGVQLDSPFDLERQATLHVVGGPATPARAEAHTKEVAELVESRHATTGGTLVLFTSHRQMRDVHARLSESLRAITQCQGDLPRAQMLARHAERVGRNEPAILFGVQALSEGLDLPGTLCSTLIVAKLPFAVPDDPIERTREKWITEQGRNYFAEIVVPRAFLRLVQMTGRLVRTETDQGNIYIADSRLRTTGYGRRMLDTLPPYRRAS
jgi:ATP-dependent DNA helicase DinG